MVEVVTDNGREFVSEKLIDETSEYIAEMAVGDGTSSPNVGDTSLDNEIYRAVDGDSNLNIIDASATGTITLELTLVEGTHIQDGAQISEIGVFTDGGRLVYREVQNAITISEDVSIRLTAEIDITQ